MNFPTLPNHVSPEDSISFDAVDVELPRLDEEVLKVWLSAVAKTYDRTIVALSYVLCSDAFLLKMNIERLDHNTYTDIITFELGDPVDSFIDGECYISLERVLDNALSFDQSPELELRRVFAHGLLHLCGLSDKSPEELLHMRKAEQLALSLFEV